MPSKQQGCSFQPAQRSHKESIKGLQAVQAASWGIQPQTCGMEGRGGGAARLKDTPSTLQSPSPPSRLPVWGQGQEGELVNQPFVAPGWQRGQQTLSLLPLSLAEQAGKS